MHALFVCLALLSADDTATDQQRMLTQAAEDAPNHLSNFEQAVKILTAELAAAKRGRINAKQLDEKRKEGRNVLYKSKAAKEADVQRAGDQLEAMKKRIEDIKAGKEICLPRVEFGGKAGRFYVLSGGVLFQVRDSTSCYWDVGGGTSAGNFSTALCLLKGLEGLDREKPETLKIEGLVFKFEGRTALLGESVMVFQRVDLPEGVEVTRWK